MTKRKNKLGAGRPSKYGCLLKRKKIPEVLIPKFNQLMEQLAEKVKKERMFLKKK